ncbi:MAG: multiheme c-type cytochrome [Gammaproteobacteria bacterium]|nr:multiheme c-type cytochrome [Gammaproteobacteria bacterium]
MTVAAVCGLVLAPAARSFPTTAFLARYWHTPVPLGGARIPHWPAFETRLSPRACALCHAAQYDAWKTSRHAQAMGPGVIGQLAVAGVRARGFAEGCLSCHAPGRGSWREVRSFIRGGRLHAVARYGVSCADCHVRHYQRFGPPLAAFLAAGRMIHNGFTPESAFTRSRFCAVCHQFHRDGARLDGVLLENTYNEWYDSRYRLEGVTCQSCHMPGGRHRFAGIHDPGFVRRAVQVRWRIRICGQRRVCARLSLTNTGVGHDFPTYTTPKVVMSIEELCGDRVCAGTRRQSVIARRINLDLTREYFDTRLPPGATRRLVYVMPQAAHATGVAARIVVYPDAAYLRFFRAYLARYRMTARERALIERALRHDMHTAYVLWSTHRRL